MRLKSLELHGFKSFADKTKLEFHEGVTGIVGPNGCGKSNIVDSMRWVLGETSAKALRGGEMSDVIFNGTDKRSSLGMAEVILTLSDCTGVLDTEFDEVSIGRRVFRDGKSEYLLNKQTCRLKDIQNLLMDTGIGRTSYSIMEQGKIDMLLSSRPEDRRAVFEEAAGITKYKAQKKEALRKLEYTEANLIRIRDVIAENERQIRSLSRQASKAKRYQSLYEDVRTLELHLAHKQWRELHAERAELTGSIHQLSRRQDELADLLETQQSGLSSVRSRNQEVERRLGELQMALSRLEHEITNAEDRIQFHDKRTRELSTLIQKNETDITDATEKRAHQEAEIENASRQLEAVIARLSEYQTKVAELETQSADVRKQREEITRSVRQHESQHKALTTTLASLDANLAANERQSLSDQERGQKLLEETEKQRQEEARLIEEAADYRDQITKHRSVIEEYGENLLNLDQQCQRAKRAALDLQESLSSLHKLLAEKQSRLDVLRQLIASGEGFEKGTQEVLRGLGDSDRFAPHIRTALADRMTVESRFTEAIEAALGPQVQAVVVEDLKIAELIISTLHEGSLGQASLIAETHLTGESAEVPSLAPLGAISWAINQVRCESEIHPLLSQLLKNVLIVEDLSTALRLREEGKFYPMATLSGEFISAEGIIHGGRSGDGSLSVLKMRTEVHELEKIVSTLDQEVSSRSARRTQLSQRVSEFEHQLREARERLQQKRLTLSNLEGKLSLVEKEQGKLQSRIEGLEQERRDVVVRTTRLLALIEEKRAERAAVAAQMAQLEESIAEANDALNVARQNEEDSTSQLTEARTKLAVEKGTREKFEEQRIPMLTRLSELSKLLDRRAGEIAEFRLQIETGGTETTVLGEKIAENRQSIAQLLQEKDELVRQREETAAQIKAGEATLSGMRRESQAILASRGKEEVRAAQLALNLENVERLCRERHRTELEFFEPDSHALLLAIAARRKSGSVRPSSESVVDEEGEPMPEEEIPSEAEFHDPAEPDWNFVESVISQLRTRLDSMGPVNIDAIEEFEELEEHYRFNQSQLQDLESSKEELIRTMARINRETRRMFAETFEQVKKNFRDMFRELFGEKAAADLILLDDSDPLECGIDIIAKPPGKKLQSISLLSGGERSMTAVALLFGIYMVKPSPFCVLDELDAPLDEANIQRFLRVLDRFIGNSQFVIVTHSKRTMSRADVMYGVSMEEFGVSKTVGVTFSKADEAKGGKQAMIGG